MDQNRIRRGWRSSPPQPPLSDDVLFDDQDYDFDDAAPPRMPSSSRRYSSRPDIDYEMGRSRPDVQFLASEGDYFTFQSDRQSHIPSRRNATRTDIHAVPTDRWHRPSTEDVDLRRSGDSGAGSQSARRFRPHWLLVVGCLMFIMVAGWVAFSALVNWWQVTQDDWHYGRPRTFQVDTVVGHNDSVTSPSHFVAINLNRHVEVIEFPGGDSSKAKIYLGPILTGDGQDLAPVILTFKDVNGDGKPDMIVSIQGSRFVYINENGAFRPARPNEVQGY